MARNAPDLYGRDIRCIRDADALFSEVSGIDAVVQDAIHRITTDSILGDDGTGSFVIDGWGFDCRRLLGMTRTQLTMHQPIIAEVLTRDPRISHADVTLTPVVTNGLADVQVEATCMTALGPFALVKLISQLTDSDLVGQT